MTRVRFDYTLIVNADCPVAQLPVPERDSVTEQLRNVMLNVVEHFKEACPSTGTRGIKQLHDNTPPHKSSIVTEYLK